MLCFSRLACRFCLKWALACTTLWTRKSFSLSISGCSFLSCSSCKENLFMAAHFQLLCQGAADDYPWLAITTKIYNNGCILVTGCPTRACFSLSALLHKHSCTPKQQGTSNLWELGRRSHNTNFKIEEPSQRLWWLSLLDHTWTALVKNHT